MASLLLMLSLVLPTVPMKRLKILDPFPNLSQDTEVVLTFTAVVIVAVVRPHVNAANDVRLAFLTAKIEVNEYCMTVLIEHDFKRVNVIVD